jgi:DNA repair exonuclease SbcCD ATPase subunit
MNDELKNPSSEDISSLEQKLQSCDAELQKVRREAGEQAQKALQNHEMLLMELQKAFHESEDYFVKWKQAEELGGNLSLNVESVTRGAFHEQGPHRYCNLTLGGVDLFERRWDRMDLRLVEHHGNAGLMVFKPLSGGSPFYSWKQDGEEGGRPFQLIIPSNSASKKWLVAAPASDLVLAQECAAFLVSDLAINGVPPGSQLDWLDVAKRLLNQILDIPERFRYDSVKILSVKLHGNPITIDFEIRNAYYRQELLGDIRFSCDYFKTGSSKFRITTLDDFYNTELVYDFTKATTIEQKRAPWQKLSVRERDIALEILKEMPNFIWHFCEQYKQFEEKKIPLQEQAKKTYRKAVRISGKKNQTGFFTWPCFTPASNRKATEDKAYGLVSAAATAPLLSKIEAQNSSISALQSDLSALISERSTLANEKNDLDSRLSTLSSEQSTLATRHQALVTSHSLLATERDELATRHQALVTSHSLLATEREALAQQLEARSSEVALANGELETRARLLVEKATQIHQQGERVSTLESERDELATRHQALVTSHSLLATEREALSTLLDVLTAGRVAQDEQMEKILSENKSLLYARDASQCRISELEHEVAQLRAHAKFIDEEFGKAEGQLDLIKDIFLRESLR